MGTTETKARRVAIAYHCFAHYRAAVLEELAFKGRHRYTFIASRKTLEASIKAWDPPPGIDFRHTYAKFTHGVVVQPGIILAALSPRYDVLVMHGVVWWPFTWPAVILARLTGKRVYYWGHGWTAPERGLRGAIRALYNRLPHGLMFYGHYAKIIEMMHGTPPERVHVIYNSLDYPAQKAARDAVTHDMLAQMRCEVMGTDVRPIAACVSRLIHVRRLDLLIDAAASLKAQGREIDLLLVGDGPERAALEAHAKARGVRAVFYGACYDEAVIAKLVMMSNVMVAPGKVGLTAMTSLACGIPVVTHDNEANQMPEWEAVIPGKTGSLFADGDAEDLARAIGRWTATPWPDPSVRRDCIEIIERFWNPANQRRCIERAIDGLGADDLFFMKERA